MFFLSLEEKQDSGLEASIPHHIEAFQHIVSLETEADQTYQNFHTLKLLQS